MKVLLLSIAILFLALSYSSAPVFAQAAWHRLESDSKDFSIAVPPGYQVLTDKEGYETTGAIYPFPVKRETIKVDDIKRITASSEGASFLVESYRTTNLDHVLEILYLGKFKPENSTDLALNSFHGKVSKRPGPVSYVLDAVVASKDRVYRIFGVARNENNESLKYFFSSIRLNGGAPFVLSSSLEGKIKEQDLLISGLMETPFIFEKAEKTEAPPPDEKMLIVPGIRPQTPDPGRLFIAYQPRAQYTTAARKKGTIGTVSLKITFGADGRIEKIVVLNGLEYGLTEEAVRVSRLIRFLPQQEDNKPVTVEKVIKYSFTIY